MFRLLYFDLLSFSNYLIDMCVVSGKTRNEQREYYPSHLSGSAVFLTCGSRWCHYIMIRAPMRLLKILLSNTGITVLAGYGRYWYHHNAIRASMRWLKIMLSLRFSLSSSTVLAGCES